MIEMGISIAAGAAVFYWGLKGASDGLFRTFTRFCAGLLALIVAMRFWFPATEWLMGQLSVGIGQVSFAAFWGLFALVILPFVATLKAIHNDYIPVYPLAVERVMGFVFSAGAVGITACAVLLSLMPNMSSVLPYFDESKLLLPIHRLPRVIYQEAETQLGNSPGPSSPAHTILPTSAISKEDSKLKVTWQ